MKNWILHIILAFSIFAGHVCAQTAAIPDSNLLKFIKRTYPNTIDANGRLVIAEAAKIKGFLYGRNAKITSLEGIQYFSNINTLDFGFNKISNVPELNSDSLESLILNDNQFSSLPSLDHIKRLRILDVADNKLSNLPNLTKLNLLEGLICKGNQLSTLPNLDSLTNLAALDISFNKLTDIPKLPKKNKIQTFNLNNNSISTLPDSFRFDHLEKLFLYNNPLTFKELIRITSLKGYDSLTMIAPQNLLKVGKNSSIKEGEILTLSTGVDQDVQDVRYDWYKNGIFVKTMTNDLFSISNASLSDSGRYTCQLRHPSFSSLVLYSDTFYVKVIQCPSPIHFSHTVSSISCNKTGSLTIMNFKNQNVTYVLKSTFNGNIQSNTSGFFAGLTEPTYQLSFRNAVGCEKNYASDIVIPKEECKQVLITPNGDGESDTYFFTQTGKVTIYDKRSASVKTLTIPGAWDGSSSSGRVSPGFYIADINNGEELMTISVVY